MSCRLQDWLSGAVLSNGPDVRVVIAPKILGFGWKGPSEVSSPILGSQSWSRFLRSSSQLSFK